MRSSKDDNFTMLGYNEEGVGKFLSYYKSFKFSKYKGEIHN